MNVSQKEDSPVITQLKTDGLGCWTRVSRPVRVTEIRLWRASETTGELRVYFDPSDWNTQVDGLIYMDQLFLRQLRIWYLVRHNLDIPAVFGLTYSDHGLQGSDYVSFDVKTAFLKAYQDINTK